MRPKQKRKIWPVNKPLRYFRMGFLQPRPYKRLVFFCVLIDHTVRFVFPCSRSTVRYTGLNKYLTSLTTKSQDSTRSRRWESSVLRRVAKPPSIHRRRPVLIGTNVLPAPLCQCGVRRTARAPASARASENDASTRRQICHSAQSPSFQRILYKHTPCQCRFHRLRVAFGRRTRFSRGFSPTSTSVLEGGEGVSRLLLASW